MTRTVFTLPEAVIHHQEDDADWQVAQLSRMQAEILWAIIQANGKPLPTEEILARVYCHGKPLKSRGALRVHMNAIYRALADAGIPKFVSNCYGKGYCIIGSIEVIE
jgi:DNA-binding winged helix-turn-helix (wHTH) protein